MRPKLRNFISGNRVLDRWAGSALYPKGGLMISSKGFMNAAKYIHARRLCKPYTHVGGDAFDFNQRFLILTDSNHIVSSESITDCFDPATGQIDYSAFEAKCPGHKIKKVIHRPNHGLDHSVSVAKYMPLLKQFKQTHIDPSSYQKKRYSLLNDHDIQRLQLMALFSVSGREDEIGFHGNQEVYKTYRIRSATEYFDYFMTHDDEHSPYHLPDDTAKLIHDAIIVELMGNTNIQEDLYDKLGILEHIKEKYSHVAEQWIGDDKKKRYFKTGFNAHLNMLNLAHGLELLRVYDNRPTVDAENRTQSSLRPILGQLMNSCRAEEDTLVDAVKLMEYARDLIEQRGDRLTTNLTNLATIPKVEIQEYLAATLTVKVNTQFIRRLLNGPKVDYRPTFFEHCHYTSQKPDDANRNTDEEVESVVCDLDQVALPEFSFNHETPREKSDKRYYVKVIQPDRLDDFLAGQFDQKKVDLRRVRKKFYSLTTEGVKPSIEKPSAFDKEGYSQHQSVTLISSQVQPAVFSGFNHHTMAGVRYDEDAVKINRMFITAGGTVRRFYDYDSLSDAKHDLKNKWKEYIFQDMDAFEKALKKKGPLNTNEVLAYLKWQNNASSVCIFRDNLSSKLVAQEYARRIAQKTMGADNTDAQRIHIPIHYYIRYSAKNEQVYDLRAQQDDVEQANDIYDDPQKREKLFLDQDYAFLLTQQNAEKVLTDRPDILLDLLALGQFFMVESLLNLSNKTFQELNFTPDYVNMYEAINKLYSEQNHSEHQKHYLRELLKLASKDIFPTKPHSMAHMIAAVFEKEDCLRLFEEKDLKPYLSEEDINGMTPAQVALLHGHVDTFVHLCEQAVPQDLQAFLVQEILNKKHKFKDPSLLDSKPEEQTFLKGVIRYGDHQSVMAIMEQGDLVHDIDELQAWVFMRRDREKLEILKKMNEKRLLKPLDHTSFNNAFKKIKSSSTLSGNYRVQIHKRNKEIIRYLFDNHLLSPSVLEDPLLYSVLNTEQFVQETTETVKERLKGEHKINASAVLMAALKLKDKRLIKLALEEGANCHYVFTHGIYSEQTPFTFALENVHDPEIFKLILGSQSNLDTHLLQDPKLYQNHSLLTSAIYAENLEALKIILELNPKAADFVIPSGPFEGKTALMLACTEFYGRDEYVGAIIEARPSTLHDIVSSGKDVGHTALTLALKEGRFDSAEFIMKNYPQTMSFVVTEGEDKGHSVLSLMEGPMRLKWYHEHPESLDVLEPFEDKAYNALTLAIEMGLTDKIRLILEENPESTHFVIKNGRFQGFTPLHLAIRLSELSIVEHLLEVNPRLAHVRNSDNTDSTQEFTPLELAILVHDDLIVKRLLKVDPELARLSSPGEGKTALFEAIQCNNTSAIADLLAACPRSIEDKLSSGHTPLTYAVNWSNEEAIETLLQVDPKMSFEVLLKGEEKGECALSLANYHCGAMIVKHVPESIYTYERLPEGHEFKDKISALEFAIRFGLNDEIDKILLSNPQVIQKITSKGGSLMQLALEHKNLTAFERMVSLAPDKVFEQPSQESPSTDLFELALNDLPLEFLTVFFEKIPEPLLTSHLSKDVLNRALSRALREENLPLVSQCLNYGADPIEVDKANSSVNHYNIISKVVAENKLNLVKVLMEHNADFTQVATEGKGQGYSAVALACFWNKMETIDLLLKAKPEIFFMPHSQGNVKGKSALMFAYNHKNYETVKFILKSTLSSDNVNLLHQEGALLLQHAVVSNDLELLELLFKHGVDLEQVFEEGPLKDQTIMSYVTEHQQQQLLDKLLTLKPSLVHAKSPEGEFYSIKALKSLFEQGANVHHLYTEGPIAGYTPFGWIISHYFDKDVVSHFIRFLDEEPVNNESKNVPEPIEMMVMAIFANNIHAFHALLEQYPDALEKSLASSKHENHPLTAAIYMNQEEYVAAILKDYPQSIHFRIGQGENEGHTPITLAIKESRPNLLKLLLKQELSPSLCQIQQGDDKGLSPTELARKYACSETQKLVQQHFKEDVEVSHTPSSRRKILSNFGATASRTEKVKGIIEKSSEQKDKTSKPRNR